MSDEAQVVWLNFHLKDGTEASIRERDLVGFQSAWNQGPDHPPQLATLVTFMRGEQCMSFMVAESMEDIRSKLSVGNLFA